LYSAALNEQNLTFDMQPVRAELLADLLNRVHDRNLSAHHAKIIFQDLWTGEQDIDAIIQKKGLQSTTNNDELILIIKKLLEQFPEQVAEYQSGKEKLLGFFIGQLMKKTKGQADPEQVQSLLKEHLKNHL
jgi:aspartyl-tRNA(Asn)/glutamyl-tRNA(Gln) amidotransferase subunit B